MFLTIFGYLVLVLICLYLTMITVVMFFFGGGDCGPMFGNWRHDGMLLAFFCILCVTCAGWYIAYKFFPFTISIM